MSNHNKIAIESLSMDLLRVALGYQRGSIKMAERFREEAYKRINEIEETELKPSFLRVIKNLPKILAEKDKDKLAEDALTYSTICKNYSSYFAK